MFYGLLEPLRRSIAVRLSLWYALFFAFSSVALLTVAYTLVAKALARKDHEVLEARLKEVAQVYDRGGPLALKLWIERQPMTVQTTLFLRLGDAANKVAFVKAPGDWVSFKDVPDGLAGYRREGIIRIPQSAERDFMLASATRPDGSLLQVGRISDNRLLVLEPLRR